MRELTFKLFGLNWRLVLALASIGTFVLAGSAGDSSGV